MQKPSRKGSHQDELFSVESLHPKTDPPKPGPANPTPCRTSFDLRRGDCVAGMASLPDSSVDVVVTSPPYNLGINYSSHDDDAPREAYLQWADSWAAQIRRVLKPDGSFFLNVGAAPANPWLPHELALQFRSLFVLQNTFHWIKSITVRTRDGEEISTGHFKPLPGTRFVTDCHEFVFHFTQLGSVSLDRLAVGVKYADKSNITRWNHTGGKDKRCRGNNWFIPYRTIRDRSSQRPHPATFPAQLAEWCIRIHGLRDDLVVLDPFLGIGHAAQGAADAGAARFIGFELDPEYFREAQKRVLLGRLTSANL